ncbi:MAG TPA: glycerol-3-phosphate acyltransferase, partial [Candidatus Binataceae bacterium]|nr:glycerol-3-phosphate acyltransferase [Candidatus Binataceae bacterium]
PFGVIVGRMRGFDPRAVGSGNIGMTNVARAGGASAAIITFVGDVLKGAIPVLLARAAEFPADAVAWVAMGAFLGSICSVFLRFHGGKGISAALGIWLVLAPLAVLIAVIAFALVFAIFRIISPASLTAALAMPPAVVALAEPRAYVLLAIVITALVILRFRSNIARLIRGEEPKFRVRGKSNGAAA